MKYLLVLSLVLFIACESTTEKSTAQATAAGKLVAELPGTWESVSINVAVNTANNTDSTDQFIVEEENWQNTLGMQPVKTRFFREGNKYVREFRNLQGVLADTLRGRWNVFGDTLMLIEPTATYQYVTIFRDGKMELTATVDWDGDGQVDDDYYAVERKVSNYTD